MQALLSERREPITYMSFGIYIDIDICLEKVRGPGAMNVAV